MAPGIMTPSGPCPVAVRYSVPSTLLFASRRTTAPLRVPGYFGVNTTLTVQLPEEMPAQVSVPDSVKSRLGAPMVSTSALLTVPEPERLTVTFCGAELCPTLTAPENEKRFCAWAESPAMPNAAATASAAREKRAVARRGRRRGPKAEAKTAGRVIEGTSRNKPSESRDRAGRLSERQQAGGRHTGASP